MAFFSGLIGGALAFWLWGMIAKGIFEPIQAKQGRYLLNKGNARVQELNDRAKQTCTQIDDILLGPLAGITGELAKAIAPEDLDPVESAIHQGLIAQNFKLGILLDKLGVSQPPQ